VVTIVYDHRAVSSFCVCGWAMSRRRTPAGPGSDLPDRVSAELQVAAEAVAEKHLRTHLVRR